MYKKNKKKINNLNLEYLISNFKIKILKLKFLKKEENML